MSATLDSRLKNRRLPSVDAPQVDDQALRQFLEGIKEHIRMYEGDSGAPKERFVTIEELELSGLVSTKVQSGFASITETPFGPVAPAKSVIISNPSSSSSTTVSGPTTFAALDDTSVAGIAAGQGVKWDGAAYVPAAFPPFVDVEPATKYDMMFRGASSWKNTNQELIWNPDLNYLQLANAHAINWLDGGGSSVEFLMFETVAPAASPGVGVIINNFEGVNGARTHTDDTGRTWTFVGTDQNNEISTVAAKFGSSSYEVGTQGSPDSDGIYTNVQAENADFHPGVRDWYVRFWFRHTTSQTGGNMLWAIMPLTGTNRVLRMTIANNVYQLDIANGGSETAFPFFGTPTRDDTFHEITVERVGTDIFCYEDGVQSGSTFDCTGFDIGLLNMTDDRLVLVGVGIFSSIPSLAPDGVCYCDAFEMKIGENIYGGVAPGSPQSNPPVGDAETFTVGDPAFATVIDGDTTFFPHQNLSTGPTIALTGVQGASIDFTGDNGPAGIRWRQTTMATSDQIDLVYRTSPMVLRMERVSDTATMIEFDAGDLSVDFLGPVNADSLSGIRINSTRPRLFFDEDGAAADEGEWLLDVNNGQFVFRAAEDGAASSNPIFTVDRTGFVVDSIAFGAPITATSYGGILEANLLDKTATETITAEYIFTNDAGTTVGVELTAATPRLRWFETGLAADTGMWDMYSAAGELKMITRTDIDGFGQEFFAVARTGTVVDLITLTATNTNVVGAFNAVSYGGILEDNLVDKTAAETITGNRWTFNEPVNLNEAVFPGFHITATDPGFVLEESDAAADEKIWRFIAQAGQLSFQTRTDADGAGELWLSVDRTGTAVDSINIGADVFSTGVFRSTNDVNADGPNFDVQTTTKTAGEYAYKVTRGGGLVAGFRVDGALLADTVVATSYDGILAANLLDKTATETVSGSYSFTNTTFFTTAGPRVANNLAFRSIDQAATINVNLIKLNTADEVIIGHSLNQPITMIADVTLPDFTLNLDRAAGNAAVFIDCTTSFVSAELSLPAIRWREADGTSTAAIRAKVDTSDVKHLVLGTEWLTERLTLGSDGNHVMTGSLALSNDLDVAGEATFTAVNGPAIVSANPDLFFQDTNETTDEKNWVFRASASDFFIQTATDAAPTVGVINAMSILRGTGTAVTSIDFGSDVNVTGQVTATDQIEINSAAPKFRWHETDAAANEGEWDMVPVAGQMLFRTRGDGDASGISWMTMNRSGTTVDAIIMNATNLTLNADVFLADNLLDQPEIRDYGITNQGDLTVTSNAATMDLTLGNVAGVDLQDASATLVLTVSNPPPTGTYGELVFKVTQGSTARLITWPSSFDWPASTAPTLSTADNAVDIITAWTIDAGTTWFATFAQLFG